MFSPEIKIEYPPNIEKIKEILTLSGKEIFAWDGIIYNPGNGYISPPLIAHENVHFKQQNGDPEKWWDRYLTDVDFRLSQELEAHREEYKEFCKSVKDRNKRSRYLFEISLRLSSSMYGNLLSQKEASKLSQIQR